jgi:hypothetical protein
VDPFGVNYMAEITSIARALGADRRGANLPYFGKQSNILPYFPHEQKRKPIQGFPRVSDTTEREKEPDTGIFSYTYFLQVSYLTRSISFSVTGRT